MKQLCLIVFAFLFIFKVSLRAQNLVPNPSFDDARGKRKSMFPWQMVNTVDYFIYDEAKKDQKIKSKIKDKNFKMRKARTGNAYVGIRYWPRYSEFLIVELLEPLEKERQYYFEMYMTISEHSSAYLRSVGVSFYDFKPAYAQRSSIYDYPPQFEVYKYNGLKDTTEWIKIAGVFTAEGGERFMTIGNFSRNNHDKFKRRKFSISKREAYYYIDDVALYKLDNFGYPILHPDTNQTVLYMDTSGKVPDNPMANEIDHYYKTIMYPTGSSELTYEAFNKLGFVIEYLNEHPLVNITIIGYAGKTEGVDESELQRLAEKRARVVFIFITGNKILKTRISLNYSTSLCSDNNEGGSSPPCNSAEILFSNDPDDVKRMQSPFFNLMP